MGLDKLILKFLQKNKHIKISKGNTKKEKPRNRLVPIDVKTHYKAFKTCHIYNFIT